MDEGTSEYPLSLELIARSRTGKASCVILVSGTVVLRDCGSAQSGLVICTFGLHFVCGGVLGRC